MLVSAGGTKTFRSTFYLNGERIDRKLGRVGEMDLADARRIALEDRSQAAKDIDPRPRKQQDEAAKGYEYVVDQFIEHYAKPRQRTWDQTARILKHNCKPFLKKDDRRDH